MTDKERLEEILNKQKGGVLPIWLSQRAIEVLADHILDAGMAFNSKLVVRRREDMVPDEAPCAAFEWVSVDCAVPAEEVFVLARVSGKPKDNITFDNAPCIATYYRKDDKWEVEDWPNWENPEVKYWAYIPDVPKESGAE